MSTAVEATVVGYTHEELVQRISDRIKALDKFYREQLAKELGVEDDVRFNLAFWEAREALNATDRILFVPVGKGGGAYRRGDAFDRVRRGRNSLKKAGRQVARSVRVLPTKAETPKKLERIVERMYDRLGQPHALIEAAKGYARDLLSLPTGVESLKSSRD